MYDVAIVGAGPGGLMAAKTATEKGLKVVLIEKRKDISQITRACSSSSPWTKTIFPAQGGTSSK